MRQLSFFLYLIAALGVFGACSHRPVEADPETKPVAPMGEKVENLRLSKVLVAHDQLKVTGFRKLDTAFSVASAKERYHFLILPAAVDGLARELAPYVLQGHLLVAIDQAHHQLPPQGDESLSLVLGRSYSRTPRVAPDFPLYGKRLIQTYTLRPADIKANKPAGIETKVRWDTAQTLPRPELAPMQRMKVGESEFNIDPQLLTDINRMRYKVFVQKKEIFSYQGGKDPSQSQQLLNKTLDTIFTQAGFTKAHEQHIKQNLIYALQTRTQTFDSGWIRLILSHGQMSGQGPVYSPTQHISKSALKMKHTFRLNGENMEVRSDYTYGVFRLDLPSSQGLPKVEGLLDVTRIMTVNVRTGEMSEETITLQKHPFGWGKAIAIIGSLLGVSVAGAITTFYLVTGFPFVDSLAASNNQQEDHGTKPPAGSGEEAPAIPTDSLHKSDYVRTFESKNTTTAYLLRWHEEPMQADYTLQFNQGRHTVIEVGSCHWPAGPALKQNAQK